MPIPVDLAIHARWVVPVEPDGVLADQAIIVQDGRILDLLPADQALVKYAAKESYYFPQHALIPGLVNAHTHAAMTLFRGIADDTSLHDWLHHAIWPREKRFLSEQFVYDGTLLAATEMLRGGITTASDMYFFTAAAGQAFIQAGMRAVLGIPILEFPTPWAADADSCLSNGLAERDQLGEQKLIQYALAPHAPYTVSDKTYQKTHTYAEQLDLPVQTHLHETAAEIQESLAQYQVKPIIRLQQLGVLGPNFTGIHTVHLDQTDIACLAHHNVSVVHCPTSNLKLGSGIAPIPDLLAAGVTIGLGTDGAASQNRLDLFAEMKLTALLAQGAHAQKPQNTVHLSAATALRLATLGGAQTLGLAEKIGSLKPGKQADLTLVHLGELECQPIFDPVSHLVYVAGREHVDSVWVAGKKVVANCIPTQINLQEVLNRARSWQNQLM